ncbi:hypothetical protein QBC37DRAFT_461885 [Rhypophila decipiens]|uniref:Rhodopsin domain-containing protein n=1 Tax=Rhypophila decipiens TaxID=261697 RepID=A0AAN6YD49_9PEZI|nr:hypothetical protein QBC37DRAFT_461885 [Rhypophila decipiens]
MVHLGADWVMGISMDWCWVFLELLFTSLRFYTRRFIIGGLWYDDYVLAAAVICDIITKSLWLASFFPLYHGAKVSEVSESHLVRADQIVGVMEPFIYTTFALSKAAVLTFLHRLSKTRWERRMLLSLAIFFTSWSISIGVLITFVIFQGLNVPAVEILSSYFGFTVFLNLFLALFPWYMFRNVQMKRSKKVTICVSLGLAGILGEIACLVRNIKSITVQHDDNHLSSSASQPSDRSSNAGSDVSGHKTHASDPLAGTPQPQATPLIESSEDTGEEVAAARTTTTTNLAQHEVEVQIPSSFTRPRQE